MVDPGPMFHKVRDFSLAPDFAALLSSDERSFDGLMAIDGKVYRALEGRRTVRFERGGRAFFIKQHFGVGWREIIKNLCSLRTPVLDAASEWRAIDHLARLGLATARVVGRGRRGLDPARRRSFVVLEELDGVVSLVDLAALWQRLPPAIAEKRRLIADTADLTRRMHAGGLNHRDYYLCHILCRADMLIPPDGWDGIDNQLYLLDLHRAQIRRKVPRRWRLKDLAGLYFSAMAAGLSRGDRLRFIAGYEGRPWRQSLAADAALWAAVERKAQRLRRRHL